VFHRCTPFIYSLYILYDKIYIKGAEIYVRILIKQKAGCPAYPVGEGMGKMGDFGGDVCALLVYVNLPV
jgi:hypothetical protein